MYHKFIVTAVGLGSVLLLLGLTYLLFVIPAPHHDDVVATPVAEVPTTSDMNKTTPAQTIREPLTVGEFTDLVPFTLGRISLLASIADTPAERELGLSHTAELPIGVAKVFMFDTSELWSFWMKDMQYPIDIFWLDENGRVVYIVRNATPESYPTTTFTPPVPARYVIETRAGFAEEQNFENGESVGMTQILMDR